MLPSRLWPLSGVRAGLAFSDRFLVAVRHGRRTETRVAELPEGLVEPSVSQPNVRSVADLGRLVADALAALSLRRTRLAVALPDLSLTTAVIDGGGRPGGSETMRRLTTRLPYPVSEARVDFWKAGDRALGAAVREAVVRQYEQAIEAAEGRIGWVDGTSTSLLPSTAGLAPNGGSWACIQLYRSHYAIAAFTGGSLVDLRLRLRSPGDEAEVAAEIARLPGVYDLPRFESLVLSGEDAGRTAAALASRSRDVGHVEVRDEGEVEHLAASVRALLSRS